MLSGILGPRFDGREPIDDPREALSFADWVMFIDELIELRPLANYHWAADVGYLH